MPVPTSIDDLSPIAIENSPQGTEPAKGTIDDYFRQHASFIATLRDQFASVGQFLQSGVGAVVRLLRDKLRETVSIKDFGAVGDGVADDTEAWQKALAHCYASVPFKALRIPAGRFTTSQTIELRPEMTVKGDGRTLSVIKYTGSGVAVRYSDASPNNGFYAFGGTFADICIEGNAASSSLLLVKNVHHLNIVNVNLRESSNVSGVGLHILGSVCGSFINVVCSTNAQLMASRLQNCVVVDRDPDSLSRATDNTFTNLIAEGALGDGVQLINSDQSMFIGGTSENHDGNGVTIAAGSRMNTFISVAFENSVGFADIFDGGFSNRFINCYTKKMVYIDTSSRFSKVEGGFHQSITSAGSFATLQDLDFSFFGSGGTIAPSATTSTRNLFNINLGALAYFPKPAAAVTVGASPFTYTNGSGLAEALIVRGGTVGQIVFKRGGGAVETLPVAGMFWLAPGDGLVISHTAAPTMVRVPFGTNYD